MKAFSIENETNNITIHASAKEAEAVVNAESFGTEAALAKLAADWSTTRLIEIWNSLPGAAPIKKFKDRATAVSRIWRAIQSLAEAAPAADQPETVTESETAAVISESPERAPATNIEPHQPDAAPKDAPANNDATPATDAPTAIDEKLLRVRATAMSATKNTPLPALASTGGSCSAGIFRRG
jgi:hypothetical protein